MTFKLFLDKSFEGGKALLYERLLSFLNSKSLMSNVNPDDCDWIPAHPEAGCDSPAALLIETVRSAS
jgi:hypothetical protein